MFLISCEIAGQERDEQCSSNLDSWNFLVYRIVRRAEQIPFVLQPFTFKEALRTTASEGLRTEERKRQAMQSGTHFAKTANFRFCGNRQFRAC